MAMSGHENIGPTRRDEDVTQSVITGGAVIAGIAGVAAIVLAILGFYAANSSPLAAIATICVGVAFLIEGGAVAARASHLVSEPVKRREAGAVSGSMALDSLAGVIGVVLGILALIGYQPMMLLGIAAIVFGVGILIASGALARLNTLFLSSVWTRQSGEHPSQGAMKTTIGLDVICGLAGIVLGILSLLGYAPLTLVLVAMLVFGCMTLLSGAVLASEIRSFFGYRTSELRG